MIVILEVVVATVKMPDEVEVAASVNPPAEVEVTNLLPFVSKRLVKVPENHLFDDVPIV